MLTIVYCFMKGDYMDLIKIKNQVIPIVEANNLILYDICVVHEYDMDIIRIIVDDPNTFDIDIDCVGKINQEILDLINDDIPDGFYLEVTSLGIEREINIPSDFEKTLDKYVFVSLYEKNQEINEKEIYGTFKSYNNTSITLDVKIKTRRKTINIDIKKIAKMRLAVEF